MTSTETTFGTVDRDSSQTVITAAGEQLRDWARRGDGNAWPCSALAQLSFISATFDAAGDLVDLTSDVEYDGMADEFDAWVDEVLIRAGYPTHPAIRPSGH